MSQEEIVEVSNKKFHSNVLITIISILFNPVWAIYLIKENLIALGKENIAKKVFKYSIILLVIELVLNRLFIDSSSYFFFFICLCLNLLFLRFVSRFLTRDEKELIKEAKRPKFIKPFLYGVGVSLIVIVITSFIFTTFFNF